MRPCEHNIQIDEIHQNVNDLMIALKCQICETEWVYRPNIDDIMTALEPWDIIYQAVGDHEPYRKTA